MCLRFSTLSLPFEGINCLFKANGVIKEPQKTCLLRWVLASFTSHVKVFSFMKSLSTPSPRRITDGTGRKLEDMCLYRLLIMRDLHATQMLGFSKLCVGTLLQWMLDLVVPQDLILPCVFVGWAGCARWWLNEIRPQSSFCRDNLCLNLGISKHLFTFRENWKCWRDLEKSCWHKVAGKCLATFL